MNTEPGEVRYQCPVCRQSYDAAAQPPWDVYPRGPADYYVVVCSEGCARQLDSRLLPPVHTVRGNGEREVARGAQGDPTA